MIHKLKILPVFFEACKSRKKTFEVRNNIDRGFQAGHFVTLREFDPRIKVDDSNEFEEIGFTGRELKTEITYVSNYDQPKNQVVFSFNVLEP